MTDTPERSTSATAPENGRTLPGAAWIPAAFALVSAAALCGVMAARYPYFEVDAEKYGVGMGSPPEKVAAMLEQQDLMAKRNAMVTFGIGGGLLAASLAAAAARCCSHSIRLTAGLVWGSAWGIATGYLGVIAFIALTPKNTLASTMSTGVSQGAVFAILGAGMGLLYGGFTKSATKIGTAFVAGILGGFGGGLLYSLVASLAASSQSTQEMIPPAMTVRFLWLAIPFCSIAYLVSALTASSGRASGQTASATNQDGT